MSKTYYCGKCKQRHITNKGIGQAHLEHVGEAPVKATQPGEPPPTDETSPQEAPAVARQGCGICNDTGLVVIGTSKDGRAYTTYCKCGQETHDERIGLTPNRKPTDRPISDEDRAEADYRRGHGAVFGANYVTATAYAPDGTVIGEETHAVRDTTQYTEHVGDVGTGQPDGGGSDESPGEPGEPEEPEAHNSDDKGDETVLPPVGDGLPE